MNTSMSTTPNQDQDQAAKLLPLLERIADALERANELRAGTNRAISGLNITMQEMWQHL